MNLSNYLQMPPAPAAPQTPQNGPAKGSAAVVGLDSGGHLKLDFAQIMARQFQQMPQLKRQDLAAASGLAKLQTRRSDPREDDANTSAAVAPRLGERPSAANDTQAYLKHAAAKAQDNERHDERDIEREDERHPSTRTKRLTTQADIDATAQALAAMQNPMLSVAEDAPVTQLPDGTPLQAVALLKVPVFVYRAGK